jgi:pilus assembly protein CpaE
VEKRLKVLVASRNKMILDALGSVIASANFEVTRRHVSNGHSDPLHGVSAMPDLVVLHVGSTGEAELASMLEHAPAMRPPTIVIGPPGSTGCMRLAMQTGARDYLEDPVSGEELIKSLERIRREAADRRTTRQGALFAVVGAKGGSGASFVAVNLAHIMASTSGGSVALLDMDLQFGSLSQYLDLKPEHGLLQALDMAEQLDGVALDAYMAKHKSGVALLGVLEEEMVLTRDIPVERFVHLLNVVKDNYDRVVVDLPRQIDDVTAAVYERAERVLLVMQQELTCLRDASRLRNILVRELGLPEERLMVVVNRYDRNLPVELPDIKRALGTEDREPMLVPNHYRNVAESINVGIPMMDHARGSAVTKALMAMQARLGGEEEDVAQRSMISRAFSNLIRG